MRILHVIESLGKASGVTTFVESVATEQRLCGHIVEICTANTPSLIPTHCTTGRHAPYDIVHIHGLWASVVHRMSVRAFKCKIPVVWSTHGMTAPWSLKHKWWKKCLPWFLYQRRDLKRAAVIHSTVEQEAKWNSALGFSRTIVAPLGTRLVNTDESCVPWSPAHTRTLLYVGRVHPVKALDRLIRAFGSVTEFGWRLRIVGPDQAGYMGELKALVGSLGIEEKVEFAGPKFDDELEAEYVACECLVLVSHTENFGATVVDAMAHGKPVITSTNTPWEEVAHRKCGWWVDNDPEVLARTLREMMSLSNAERAELGASGRKLVKEKYTWKAVSMTLLGAYERVVDDYSRTHLKELAR